MKTFTYNDKTYSGRKDIVMDIERLIITCEEMSPAVDPRAVEKHYNPPSPPVYPNPPDPEVTTEAPKTPPKTPPKK